MPVAASNGISLFLLTLAHAFLQSVVDTRSVGDDKRRTVVSLRLADGLQRLCLVCTHCNLGNIHIAVGRSHQAEVFLAHSLACCGKLGDGSDRCSLRRLTAGVGINLRIQNKNIDVLARRNDMVETSVADVV